MEKWGGNGKGREWKGVGNGKGAGMEKGGGNEKGTEMERGAGMEKGEREALFSPKTGQKAKKNMVRL